MVGSSDANLFTSVSAGIKRAVGPLHGGANQAVLEMLDDITANGGDVKEFVRRSRTGRRREAHGLRSPRLPQLRPARRTRQADRALVLGKLGGDDKMLEIAMALEETALTDEYFIERKLYPNVDFYTGLIYRAMGFPTRMFTVLFALGRLPGWIAHWREMHEDPATKIGRPRQIYTGYTQRGYVDLSAR